MRGAKKAFCARQRSPGRSGSFAARRARVRSKLERSRVSSGSSSPVDFSELMARYLAEPVTTYELPPAFLRELGAEFPSDLLSTDASDLETYGRDWTRVFSPAPSGVARPR